MSATNQTPAAELAASAALAVQAAVEAVTQLETQPQEAPEVVYNLYNWKSHYTAAAKRGDSVPAFTDYLAKCSGLRYYTAVHKHPEEFPSVDFAIRNFVTGTFHRLSPHIRRYAFCLSKFDYANRTLTTFWVFEGEHGSAILTMPRQDKKKKDADEDDNGDEATEDKDIHDSFEWTELQADQVSAAFTQYHGLEDNEAFEFVVYK
jgi:hypothetical protein